MENAIVIQLILF